MSELLDGWTWDGDKALGPNGQRCHVTATGRLQKTGAIPAEVKAAVLARASAGGRLDALAKTLREAGWLVVRPGATAWTVCRECGYEAPHAAGLHKHVRHSHEMDAWAYYSRHLDALKARILDGVAERVIHEDLGPCWEWTGSCGRGGYGKLRINGGPTAGAHRLSVYAHAGELPDPDTKLLHQCDNPSCCNPDHLRWGTHQENMAERAARGRTSAGTSHYAAKLSHIQVQEVRQRSTWGWSSADIASKYEVSEITVQRLLNGETYKDVPYNPEYDGNFIPF